MSLVLGAAALAWLMAKKYPNPAVTHLSWQFTNVVNQYSADIKIIGVVENIGPAKFNYSGTASLYRASQLVGQKPFGALASRQSVNVEFVSPESYFPNPGQTIGLAGAANFTLTITFPGIQAKPEEIDGDMGNNSKTIFGAEIGTDLYNTYAQQYREKLAALINQYRQGNPGLGPLTLDTCISKAAQLHSEWMRVNDSLSHYEGPGNDWSTRCQSAGCACAAENGYEGGMAPSDAFNTWKTSPGHNSNMLAQWTKIGIGISGGYVAADFQ